jgi:hypothetical protein
MAESLAPSSGADALVADLAADGTVDSRGQFTLDPARARELLRDFRLADPDAWAAELIQTATLLGATRLEATVDRDQVQLWFDGEPLTAEELELADSALLGRVETPRQRAVAQLAATLAGAMATSPEEIRVASGGHVLLRRPGAPDRIAPGDPSEPGTRLLVLRRSPAGETLPEAGALARRGEHADLELRLNGRSVSRGLRPPTDVLTVDLAGDGFAGVARLSGRVGTPGLLIRQHGLVIAEERIPDAYAHLQVVVDAPAAERDLGLGSVREGPLLDAIRRAVTEAADRLLAAIPALGSCTDAERRETLCRALRSAFVETGRLPSDALARLRVWPRLTRFPMDPPSALGDLVSGTGSASHLRYTTLGIEEMSQTVLEAVEADDRILRARDEAEARALERRLGVPAVSLDAELGARSPCRTPSLLGFVKGWYGLLLWIPLAVIVGSVLGLGSCYRHRVAQRSWPAVVASPERIEVYKYRDSDNDTTYAVRVVLRYEAGGRSYRHVWGSTRSHVYRRDAQQEAGSLRQRTWRVLVDPRLPSRSVMKPERAWVPLVVGGVLVFLSLWALWLWWGEGPSGLRFGSDGEEQARLRRFQLRRERLRQGRLD